MKKLLHILMVEDSAGDAELTVRHIEQAGHAVEWEHVDDAAAFKAAMEHQTWDVILCDHSMPGFSGLDALAILRASGHAVPFIFVSGTMGEDAAVGAMQAGAQDYVVKGNFKRLMPAIERGLRDAPMRAQKIQAEQLLKLRTSALEAAANAVVIVQRDGLIQWVNPAFTSLTGYSAAEAIGQNPRLLQSGQHERAFYANLWQTIVAGRVWRGAMINRRKDGSLYPEDQTITPVRDARGEITHFISIKQDVTEQKRLEEQFIEAQKMEVVGHLASGVAHDFNNILGVVMGYSELLTAELEPDSPLQKYVEAIRHASERAAGLTRQLLVFSRKQTVQPVVLDLNEVLKDLDKMLRRLLDEHIEMTMVPGKQIGRVKADGGYVGQVLMNLVVNARDAMPHGGKLTIATSNVTLDENYSPGIGRVTPCAPMIGVTHQDGGHGVTRPAVPPGDYVMLTVSDTGNGMTEAVKARLFEAFFTTKPKGKGTGLGLTTCQTIVQQSGGHIVVHSEVGKGTTFKVYFPRVEQLLEAATPTETGPLPHGTETLLFVEDEASVRHLACRALETLGYRVLRANNGQEGLHMARDFKGPPIQMVITDVIMPLMGGKVLAEWMKTTNPDLKILFTSGYTDDAIAHHGVLEPGVAFLPKPYTLGVLARKVRAVLDNQTGTAFLRQHDLPANQSPPVSS